MPFTEIEALTILSAGPSLGSIKIRELIGYFHSASSAIQNCEEWVLLPSFKNYAFSKWKNYYQGKKWIENLELIERLNIKIISYFDSLYPKKLFEIYDPPIILYLQGNIAAINDKTLAVIGSRDASEMGKKKAEEISSELAQMGYVIVSGLAKGIDTAAHKGALKYGSTVAVLGSGFGHIYPKENSQLSKQIIESGALLSEYPINTPPEKSHFIQRNRIVSGLSEGVILVEAKEKSGAMNTIEKAFSQKRKIFTFQKNNDLRFQGNLNLLKKNKAHLIERAQDVAYHMNNSYNYNQINIKTKILLDKNEENFLSILPNEELSINKIEALSDLPSHEINVLLMSLILKDAIKEYPGKIYKKLI